MQMGGHEISEKTPVKLGFIVLICSVLLGAILSGVWWAATVTVKLDNILIQNAAAAQLQSKLADDVADLKAWKKLVESNGSPAAQQTAKDLELIKKDLELHKALDDKRLGPIPAR